MSGYIRDSKKPCCQVRTNLITYYLNSRAVWNGNKRKLTGLHIEKDDLPSTFSGAPIEQDLTSWVFCASTSCSDSSMNYILAAVMKRKDMSNYNHVLFTFSFGRVTFLLRLAALDLSCILRLREDLLPWNDFVMTPVQLPLFCSLVLSSSEQDPHVYLTYFLNYMWR